MASERLDREAWVRAGLRALERDGVAAVSAVALSKALDVTRGSFYWHFDSRDELLEAVLASWEQEHSDAVLDQLAAVEDPRERLRLLLDAAASKPPSLFVRLLEAQGAEPAVAAVLARSRERRIAFVACAYREAGLPPAVARRRALALYALYVGLAQLSGQGGRSQPNTRERRALSRELRALFVPQPPGPE